MRKIYFIFLILMFLGSYGVFAGGNRAQANVKPQTYELVLITDFDNVDDNAFNHGSWEGLVRYAREKNISHKFYQPTERSETACLAAIDLAVQEGAKVIVTPSYLFEAPVFIAQTRYPDVRFILVDGVPRSYDRSTYRTGNNTVSILYSEDQAGFLAGYAVVMDGNRRLGFIGGEAVPTVVRFGYGFIQGIEYAATELGLAPGSITVNYNYAGSFMASQEIQRFAASWYNDGVEVIFACGGAIGNSIITAAEQAGKKVIGVDVDQSSESPVVITSAMKGLQSSVYSCISDYYAGRFPGGQTHVFSAINNGVGLPMATSRFRTFGKTDYDIIYQRLVNGTIPRVETLDSEGSPISFPVKIAEITEIR